MIIAWTILCYGVIIISMDEGNTVASNNSAPG